MKKSLKNIGIGLLALGLAGSVQEGMATTKKQTNNKVLEVLEKTEVGKSDTYTTTAANFEKQENTPLNMTELAKVVNDSTKTLVKIYGEEVIDTRFRQINEKYPNFEKLSEKEKESIIKEYFGDGLSGPDGNDAMILMIFGLLSIYAIYLDHMRRKTKYI